MIHKPMAWQSVFAAPTKKRRSHEDVVAQGNHNNDLAKEYRSASQIRRSEILQEYYDGNKFWICYWPRWDREHWAELTQIFVSYWHEAFMRYKPTTEKSVFNFFMDRLYKSSASQEYRRWINKEALNTNYEFDHEDGSEKRHEGRVRMELFIHPQSDFDRAVLKNKLCRNLDNQQKYILEEVFFGNRTMTDIAREILEDERRRYVVKEKITKLQIQNAEYAFKKRNSYENMLNQMYLNVSKDELRALISQNDADHPPKLETVYNCKGRHKKWGPTEGRRKPVSQLAEAA